MFARSHGVDRPAANAQTLGDFPLRYAAIQDEPLDFVDHPGRDHSLPPFAIGRLQLLAKSGRNRRRLVPEDEW
jgi:hypothetical protein